MSETVSYPKVGDIYSTPYVVWIILRIEGKIAAYVLLWEKNNPHATGRRGQWDFSLNMPNTNPVLNVLESDEWRESIVKLGLP